MYHNFRYIKVKNRVPIDHVIDNDLVFLHVKVGKQPAAEELLYSLFYT